MGRPKGFDMNFSMRIVLNHLKKMIFFENIKFHFCSNFNENDLENKKFKLENLILENLRFEPGKRLCVKFSKKVTVGLIFILPFAVCHRNDASINQCPNYLNSIVGLLLQKEIKELQFINFKIWLAINGGSKIVVNRINKKLTLNCQM